MVKNMSGVLFSNTLLTRSCCRAEKNLLVQSILCLVVVKIYKLLHEQLKKVQGSLKKPVAANALVREDSSVSVKICQISKMILIFFF